MHDPDKSVRGARRGFSASDCCRSAYSKSHLALAPKTVQPSEIGTDCFLRRACQCGRIHAVDFGNRPRETAVRALQGLGIPGRQRASADAPGPFVFYGKIFSPHPSADPEGLRSSFVSITAYARLVCVGSMM